MARKTFFLVPDQTFSYFLCYIISHIFIVFRLHVLAGVFPDGVCSKTDNKLAVLWEETYIRNMKYAAQRLEEVRQQTFSCFFVDSKIVKSKGGQK